MTDSHADPDETDLDIVVELVRRALDQLAALSPEDRATYVTHGFPVVAMLDGQEPVDVPALREHLLEIGDSAEMVDTILGPTDGTAHEAVKRARALRLARVWGQGHPGEDG